MVVVSVTHTLWAAMPQVDHLTPQGGQRGQAIELHLHGLRLESPQDLVWYDPGIETVSLRSEGDKNNHVVASLRIAPECTLGQHRFRLYTLRGLSALKTFSVGPYPQVEEQEPNNTRDVAQRISVGTTVEGIILNEDVDYYRFAATRGPRVSVEMEAVRLGHYTLDGYLSVLDTNRFEIAVSDDSAQFLQDPLVSFIAPYDGDYVIEVRESSYGGNPQARYRLHLGHHPRPATVFPPGGKPGETLDVTFLGDTRGSFTQQAVLPEAGNGSVWAMQDTQECPSATPVRVMPFEWYNEVEPNPTWKGMDTNSVPSVPLAFHGIVGPNGDQDWFVFRATKGTYHVEIFARRLGSPLDPVVTLFNAAGKYLKGNDDSRGMDSYVRWEAPKDGQYFVRVQDQLRGGSSNATYRLEITPVAPTFSLNFVEFKRYTQQRQHIVVPRGNRGAALLGIKREDFGGEISLNIPDLPPGVTASVFPAAGDLDRIPVIFHASTNAPFGAVLVNVDAQQTGVENGVRGHLEEDVELLYGNPNRSLYFSTRVERAALAVTQPEKFRIRLEQPSVPILHGGTLDLNVHVERDEGFDKKIRVRMIANPPGITSAGEVSIPPGKTSARYRLSATGAAGNLTRKIAVIAAVAGPEEATWVASEAIDLVTEPPHVSGNLALTVVQQATEGNLFCTINSHRAFDGHASIRLVGLPQGVTTEEQQFTNGTATVRFPLVIAKDAKRGQHKNLFCYVEVPTPGGKAGQSIASGGVLRVDAPTAASKAPRTIAKVKAPAAATPKKPLSRLEQLRQQRKKGM